MLRFGVGGLESGDWGQGVGVGGLGSWGLSQGGWGWSRGGGVRGEWGQGGWSQEIGVGWGGVVVGLKLP